MLISAERVESIFARMEERKDRLCTSSFAVAETMVGPYKSGEQEMIQRVRDFFRPPFVKVIPFTDTTADRFARLRAELGLSSADAIHLACAAEANVDVFLTSDRSLASRVVPGIQFITGLDGKLF
jgi:predicted nucleic acid-binding protein